MKDTLQIISIQHELSMAIGNDLRLENMLKIFLRVSIARLNLSSTHVFLFSDDQLNILRQEILENDSQFTHFLSIPQQFQGRAWDNDKQLHVMVNEYLRGNEFTVTIKSFDKNYQIFSIPGHGVIVFESVYEFDSVVKHSLIPIFKKLSMSCYACIAHEKLVKEVAARRAAENLINHQASHDELTNLYNRRELTARLNIAMDRSAKIKKFGALIFIDLNQFKPINDTMGHNTGDQILTEVADRLKKIAAVNDVVARFGGDEFIVLLPDLGLSDVATECAVYRRSEEIQRVIEEPFSVSGITYNISCSMGFEIFPAKGQSCNDIIKNADLAMYEAKTNRQRNAQRYNPLMSEKLNTRLAYIAEIKNALKNNEFRLYYQPQFNVFNEIIGAEALLRWNTVKHFTESPSVYISIAEDSDLILAIGDWVLSEACRQLKEMEENGLPVTFKKLAINVSARQLNQDNFLCNLRRIIKLTGVNASLLAIEITENILIGHMHNAVNLIAELKAMGVECIIDDFGTGYSSLAYLKKLPANMIKIDRSFVKDINKDIESRSIAKMIISLGENLDMDILAEGVETKDELNCLKQLGCNKYQGFYFSQPLSFDDLYLLVSTKAIDGCATNR